MNKPPLYRKSETRAFSAHHMLLHAAERQIADAELSEIGRFNKCLAAMVMTALEVEALANAVGSRVVADWPVFERLPPYEKIEALVERLSIVHDSTKEPWTALQFLGGFRNEIAHAKPEKIAQDSVLPDVGLEKTLFARPLSRIERQITPGNARRAYSAVNALKRLLNDALPAEVIAMRFSLILVLMLFLQAACYATTVEQVVQALVAPAQKSGNPGDWASVNQLAGMKWQWVAPKQTPAGYTWYGTVRLDDLGDVTVYFTGSRTGAQQLSIALPEGVDKREFTTTLTRLMPSAKIRQLRGGCKEDGEIGGSAIYQLVLTSNASVDAMMMTGTSKSGLDTELIIARQMDSNWKCSP